MLQYHFRWKNLSLMAGITWWNFYFQIFPGTIKASQIIEFLTHSLRHLRPPLLVIWDGLPGHRSADVPHNAMLTAFFAHDVRRQQRRVR